MKKINNENEKNEENKEIENDPLEDIDEQLLKDYELIVKIIGEEGLKKLFSKSGKWKGEGFKNFLEKMENRDNNKDYNNNYNWDKNKSRNRNNYNNNNNYKSKMNRDNNFNRRNNWKKNSVIL